MALVTSQDIINQGLRFAGELTDAPNLDTASEYRSRALDYLNRVYEAVLSGGNEYDVEMGEPFSWALNPTPGIFVVQPEIDVTVTLTQNSTAGTFASIPLDENGNQVSLKGRYIRVQNLSDVYQIIAHTAGQTAFTIDFGYIQPNQTGISATTYQLRYTLGPSILRLTTSLRLYQIQSKVYDGEIVGSNLSAMLREFPIAFLQARYPDRFSPVFYDSSTGNITIQVNTSALDYARVEYDYVPIPTALADATVSIPIVPLQHRMVLAYGVAYHLCLDKNDNRAQNYLQLLQNGLISMVKAEKRQRVDTNRERARLTPRQDLLKRRSVPWWWGRW